MVAVGESRRHAVEPMGMSRASVQEAQGRTARMPPFEPVEGEAADMNLAAPGRVTSEG